MRIARIEAFQVQWRTDDPPSARSGFLRVWSDDGRCGLGEVSPMQGGLVSLVILEHHVGPAIVGADPLDHAVIHDRLLHRLVKLGPEGALTSALAALDIALWDLKGPAPGSADLAAPRRGVAHRAAFLLLDRRQRRDAQPGRGAAHRGDAPARQAGGDQDPLRQ